MVRSCPNCGHEELRVFLTEDEVCRETRRRTQFVLDRTGGVPPPEQRKDLTDFAHGAPAAILQCPECATLARAEQDGERAERYIDDEYSEEVMEHLLPRYLDSFRGREQPYRALLAPGAEVLEIGSHFGAFLEVCGEWGWRAVGVDIGRDTSRFVNSRGLVTYNQPLEDCRFPDRYFDGVFVWNCFEQIADPQALLGEVHRVVKLGGCLVLRVPNGLFYRAAETYLRSEPHGPLATCVTQALGYNNLLAFPYLYGYDAPALTQMIGARGFVGEAALNSEVIALPFPDLLESLVEEHQAALAALRGWSVLAPYESLGIPTGPWIEIICRAF